MRLFTAIQFNEETIQELLRLQRELKRNVKCRKWQTPHHMHLTLHFLGELSRQQSELVQQEMEAVATTSPAFSLRLAKIGAFPNLTWPRVLWAGVQEQTPGLYDLQKTLAARLAHLGLYKEEKRYRPHITLAREPDAASFPLPMEKLPCVQAIAWTVQEIVLFHSTLTPQGPIYHILGTYPLTGMQS
ncbi:2'-5' RNA ligase [Aneurinibacillus thermoaerophilus]|uniref:RNA 2',3'-cyclic phosphodiesterase n=1 Tax=Aneurinibacillus thermoaerophilus TaxID=143495 RepID=A0A1G7YPW9_ANETH|nr:RNA 2',3'-cyclic phosphodiesterase [Aneurinibacillus thermoaerophilus]SDG98491.1 2'-5' RNA ligase [Aneurinibacillus thermoaerophilus]